MTDRDKLIEVLRQIPLSELAPFLQAHTKRPCEKICAYWWQCAKGGDVTCVAGISSFLYDALFEGDSNDK